MFVGGWPNSVWKTCWAKAGNQRCLNDLAFAGEVWLQLYLDTVSLQERRTQTAPPKGQGEYRNPFGGESVHRIVYVEGRTRKQPRKFNL